VLPRLADGRRRGTTTNVEGPRDPSSPGRQQPPARAQDWRIICDLANRLGAGDKFAYEVDHDIFEELRFASKGGVADYAGITWERIDREMGVFWPCPSLEHPGTPRPVRRLAVRPSRRQGAFSAGRLAARRRRSPDADYPIRADDGTGGLAVSVGHQTRRIGALVDQYPQPRCEIHPGLAVRSGSATAISSASRAGAAPSSSARRS
jgi:assimilatory nitrate reductase catalytic subunit